MANPLVYFTNHNCCKSVLLAANEKLNLGLDEKAMNLALGFGTGMKVGSVCGAITGGIMAISSYYENDPRMVTVKTKEFIKNIKDKFGTLECRELKAKKISCEEMVETAYNTLLAIL
ncbi:C-GCAxxG-C-C family protein [Aceticella autotrophica]|uniref:C-GCAxxG-C-C family protein n=1 Tax=Aceticella autotrophica TaxID=2755338 RepID=A0A975AW21_9THEO|nr:C-GCAxxG-C-C family (seleno)protein [Aceticella autotrophica]MDI6604017.1 C-GCAxxG-C-C family (seleno)protein [Thermoanaerobacteraceae bacterium]QSZ27512.1 C-GCAxxG-C-C family protein [Aceticella autotrophica]